eukprot:CAMPEP_0168566946 /NCGR_PEP_ID=MMETSP0413-20121227/14712_1 /TAXON_ID=136452 /ORGANISM="Filamoeba nolandi, Strain NC-AS-23-1" /LENGTH=1076 /DNA_ID=CAMNT_0008599043 /DNA_START=92 /DNA_END=3319 /DNA_ORIENTATION=+
MTTIETHIPQRFNAIEEYYEPHTTYISSSIQQHHEDDAWVQSSSSESESISDDEDSGAHSKDSKRNKRSAKKGDSDDERPKKRGKGPKKKTSSPDTEYIPINQYQPNVNSVNDQSGSPLIRKKKRGRPPKKKPEELLMDASMMKQESFGTPSGSASMVTVGSDGKLYATNPTPPSSKNGILQMMPHPLASIPTSALPTSVQALRSTAMCFYDKCTFNNKRTTEAPDSPSLASKPLILHPKFEGQIRGCKKHFDKWKALPVKPGSCELCRGLNIGESVPETEHSKYVQTFVNSKNQQFQLCAACSHRQAAVLGLVAAPKPTKMDMIENNLAMTLTMPSNPVSDSESPGSDSDSDSSDSSSDSSSSSDSDSDSSKDTETVKSKPPKVKKKKVSPSKQNAVTAVPSIGSITYTVYKTSKPPAGWETFGKGITYSSSLQYEDQSKPAPPALSITYIDTEPAPFQLSIRKRANSADGALFADSDIGQGVCIGEFIGKVGQTKRKQRKKFAFLIADADIEIDATSIGNETRFVTDVESGLQPNIKLELTDGHVVCIAMRNIAKGEELVTDYGSGHLREREVFYLETFGKIKNFNDENLIGEEKNHSAFDWFLNEGWSLLKQKAKVTVPIDHRLPAKKGLANNFKTAKSFSNSSVKNPLEWGYVAQLEKLDLVRAREDCWVTFKAGKHWNYDAFRNALSLWKLRTPNHNYIPAAPSPVVPKKKAIAQPPPPQPVVQNLASSQTTGQANPSSGQPQSGQGYSSSSSSSQTQAQSGFVSSLFANATSTGQNRDRERENSNNNPNNNNTHANPAQQFKQDKKAATQALLRANKIPQGAAIHLVTRCQLEEIKFTDLSIKFETSLLGSGKHGYVFKGYWRGFPVAVRFPSLKSQITFEERQKFIRECNQTAVYHPNVTTSYACCVTDQLCLSMEFMNLGNLKQWLLRTSPHVHAMYLSRIALDVARAMEFIHYKGLVHSRLHSNNVLLKGEPLDHGLIAGFEVKVSDIGPPPTEDFYYATSLHEPQVDSSPFVSPELLQSKRYTKQSDVYAFGMILCHLFSEGAEEPKSVQEVMQTSHYLQLWDMKW